MVLIISSFRLYHDDLNRICFFVCRTELCRFSGQKIYPGKGIRFIGADSQVIPSS
jgi:hypothetical protein